ncbi:MAG: hypothetical protein AAF081_01765 [Actinomycetota bacterium]
MADRCWRCGVEITSYTTSCSTCGAEVRATAPAIELLIEPQPVATPVDATTGEDRLRPLIAGIALVAAVVGFFVITDTDDGPADAPTREGADAEPAEAEPDTGSIAAQTAPGDPELDDDGGVATIDDVIAPIDWRDLAAFPDAAPVALVELDDAMLVFSTPDVGGWLAGSEPLAVTRLTADGSVTDLGTVVGGDAQITAIAPSGDGVVATGLDADGAPTVWRSVDGSAWQDERLPAVALGSTETLRPDRIVELDGVIVVTGRPADAWRLVQAEVTDTFGDLGGTAGIAWGSNGNRITIYGPLGIVVGELDSAELGIDLDNGSNYGEPGPVWVHDDGAWASSVSDGQVDTLTAAPGGSIHIVETGRGWQTVWAYQDGMWVQREADTSVWSMHAWREGFVAVAPNEYLTFFDHDHLPTGDRLAAGVADGNYVSAIGTGPAGVLATMTWWDQPRTPVETREEILRDGYTLTVNSSQVLSLTRDGETISVLHTWSSIDERAFRVDLDRDEPVVVFLDPPTGDDLVTFTLAELADLERRLTPSAVAEQLLSATFTPDGETWYGGPVRATDLGDIPVVAVGTDRVFLAMVHLDTDGSLGFRLWDAPIPGQ